MDIDKKTEFTKEDLEVLNRKFGGADPTRIPNPDPNFVYRYIRKDYPNSANIEKRRGDGWHVVNDKAEIEKLGLRRSESGCAEIPPDVVLAKMPRRLADEIKRRVDQKRKNQRAMADNRAKDFAQELSRQLGTEVPYIGGNTPMREGGK